MTNQTKFIRTVITENGLSLSKISQQRMAVSNDFKTLLLFGKWPRFLQLVNEWRPSRERCGLKREKRKIPSKGRRQDAKPVLKWGKGEKGRRRILRRWRKKEAKIPELLAHPPRWHNWQYCVTQLKLYTLALYSVVCVWMRDWCHPPKSSPFHYIQA